MVLVNTVIKTVSFALGSIVVVQKLSKLKTSSIVWSTVLRKASITPIIKQRWIESVQTEPQWWFGYCLAYYIARVIINHLLEFNVSQVSCKPENKATVKCAGALVSLWLCTSSASVRN